MPILENRMKIQNFESMFVENCMERYPCKYGDELQLLEDKNLSLAFTLDMILGSDIASEEDHRIGWTSFPLILGFVAASKPFVLFLPIPRAYYLLPAYLHWFSQVFLMFSLLLPIPQAFPDYLTGLNKGPVQNCYTCVQFSKSGVNDNNF